MITFISFSVTTTTTTRFIYSMNAQCRTLLSPSKYQNHQNKNKINF
jgi:hypothetical protein